MLSPTVLRRPESFYKTTISASISATSNQILVDTPPVETSGYLTLEPRTPNEEIILYTGVAGNTLTGVIRGLSATGVSEAGGAGLPHGSGSPIGMTVAHYYVAMLQAAFNAHQADLAHSYRGWVATTAGLYNIASKDNGDTALSLDTLTYSEYNSTLTYGTFSGSFTNGEIVTGGTSGATGTVLSQSAGLLRLGQVTGKFVAAETITGSVSGTTATVSVAPHWQNTAAPVSAGLASDSVIGITRLSFPPVNPFDPIAVGDNDPRLSGFPSVAGENIAGIATPQAVMVLNDLEQTLSEVTAEFGGASTTVYRTATKFRPHVAITSSQLQMYLGLIGSPTDNVVVRIETSVSNLPSGTTITNGASPSIPAASLSTAVTLQTINFASAFSLSANTDYWIVLERTNGSGDDTNHYVTFGSTVVTSYADFAGATFPFGGPWASGAGNPILNFKFVPVSGESFSTWLSDADNAAIPMRKFTGFVITDTNRGLGLNITVVGAVPGFNGLDEDEIYYVQDTPGAVGLVPSSTTVLVAGRAITTKAILINSSVSGENGIPLIGYSQTLRNSFANTPSSADPAMQYNYSDGSIWELTSGLNLQRRYQLNNAGVFQTCDSFPSYNLSALAGISQHFTIYNNRAYVVATAGTIDVSFWVIDLATGTNLGRTNVAYTYSSASEGLCAAITCTPDGRIVIAQNVTIGSSIAHFYEIDVVSSIVVSLNATVASTLGLNFSNIPWCIYKESKSNQHVLFPANASNSVATEAGTIIGSAGFLNSGVTGSGVCAIFKSGPNMVVMFVDNSGGGSPAPQHKVTFNVIDHNFADRVGSFQV